MWMEIYLYLLLILKLSILYLWIKQRFKHDEKTAHSLSKCNMWFDTLVSLLMIYLFHPFSSNPVYIYRETKLFLFTFAFLTLIHTLA